jgi:hypothetical protein
MRVKIKKDKEDIYGVKEFLAKLDKEVSEEEQKLHEEHRKDPYSFAVTDLTFCPRASYYKKSIDAEEEGLVVAPIAKLSLIRGILYD